MQAKCVLIWMFFSLYLCKLEWSWQLATVRTATAVLQLHLSIMLQYYGGCVVMTEKL